ncbi:MAG: proline--tRNA ligase [Puniceicoccales bacterium]|jgi:prolyl-tRNA synthetase|nr:proline--tRNA ligase [Puniceicoccales bacterium]
MGKTAITPARTENYAEWYQQVVRRADLAETSPVRGCMTIKPWGCRIWEIFKESLDRKLKESGHENVYFPLLIPLRFLQKEAKHVEGFAKECAVVTHSRLQADAQGRLMPSSPLEEPLVIRPTSETIVGEAFSRWIQSHRDLPLRLNQWANVVRWEMRPRLFLRTTEFLWQEGHTAHTVREEALEETRHILEIYRQTLEEELAIPVWVGEKTAGERFPGAHDTFTLEAMMQDGKALQCGTSHFLGQNFSRAMDIVFVDTDGQRKHAWTTSWGVTTRLIGGLVMTHSDDNGLVLPPKMAPLDMVVIPILGSGESGATIGAYADKLCAEANKLRWEGRFFRAHLDNRDIRGGEKRWDWIKKGVPIIAQVGLRETQEETVSFVFRDDISRPHTTPQNLFLDQVGGHLSILQKRLFDRAKKFQEEHTQRVETAEEFYRFFHHQTGFAVGFWAEDAVVEERLKRDLKVTVRCLPLVHKDQRGNDLFTGHPNARMAIFAKSY